MAGGRPRFGVWKHFNRVEGTKDVTCKKCFELISNAKVEKLDRHVIISCQRWTENDRNALKLSVAQERQPNASRASLDSSSSGSDSSSTSSNIALTQKRFDQLVADFIFSGGYPLRTVEKRGFAKFALEGRPAGLKIPSRRLLSTDLLDEAYDREMEKLVEALKKCPFEGMVLDGCSSVSHEKKLNFVVVAPNLKPKLWKVVPTGSNSQSGEYIAKLTMKMVDEIEAAVGKVGFVAGVNTDNAKAMQRAWEILEAKRGIICAGCGAHTLNLLLQDIGKLDIIKEVVEKAVRVATYFISRHLLLARLETERSEVHNAFGHTVSLPVVTRWYSTYNSLVSVIKNREAIAGVFQDHQFMSQYKPNQKSKATPSTATRASNKRKRGSEPTQHAETTPPPAKSEYETVEKIVQDESFWKL